VNGNREVFSPAGQERRDADLVNLRNTLGDKRFEQLFAEGHALSLDEAVALVLEE
jgi:hypothetical protein